MNTEANHPTPKEPLVAPEASRDVVLRPSTHRPETKSSLTRHLFHRSTAGATGDLVSAFINGANDVTASWASARELMDDPLNPAAGDPLWELLGQARLARPVAISPFFARNVLREIRKAEADKAEGKGTLLGKLRAVFRAVRVTLRPALPGAGKTLCLALALGLVTALTAVLDSGQESPVALGAADAEVVSNLEVILARDSSNVWLEHQTF